MVPFTFWENSCLAESLPLMAEDVLMACPLCPNTRFSQRSAQGDPAVCSPKAIPAARREPEASVVTLCGHSSEHRPEGAGQKGTCAHVSVQVLVLWGTTTCLRVPVHRCPVAAASLHVQWCECTARWAALLLERWYAMGLNVPLHRGDPDVEGLGVWWAHFLLLIDFRPLSSPVLDSSLLSAFARKLLPLPSKPDFPESPARYSCKCSLASSASSSSSSLAPTETQRPGLQCCAGDTGQPLPPPIPLPARDKSPTSVASRAVRA